MNLNGKSILITGATGSFGKEFIRTILERYEPTRVIVYSRDELKQHNMQQNFPQIGPMRYFIGDVRDESRLEMALRGVDVVIHAAALKQVPSAEYNPFECVRTNIHGAENIVNAAIRTGVKRVIALSTDKAANPINLYGATKLASDKIFIAGNNLSPTNGTKFSVVRYGNVLGSRGSVLPLFKKLVDAGETTLPITDERMTRFWITLEQGVDFVLESLERMLGGEIFIPKLPSMRITDLAEAVLPGCSFKSIGIRPGEKLHEVMIPLEEARVTLELGNQYLIEPAFSFWSSESYKDKHEGSRVSENFEYSSNTNKEWVSTEELREIIAKL
ncbi:MAG: UDP-N-acetylglucosamine 4,6-dehydratase (inverting) [Magnetovibrio sp.]|nr:UDP-N-acetylglucosamine 4,6-dehydratase (inverting) [Magnetovibrio sp.]